MGVELHLLTIPAVGEGAAGTHGFAQPDPDVTKPSGGSRRAESCPRSESCRLQPRAVKMPARHSSDTDRAWACAVSAPGETRGHLAAWRGGCPRGLCTVLGGCRGGAEHLAGGFWKPSWKRRHGARTSRREEHRIRHGGGVNVPAGAREQEEGKRLQRQGGCDLWPTGDG